MALTPTQQQEMQRIFGPLLIKRIGENENGGLGSIVNALLDPAVDPKPFVKTQLQNTRADLVAEQGALVSNAQARNNQINTELAIIDSILAQLP